MGGCYCFCYCYLDSSNKINCISSLFFEEIYILSLPSINKFLWSVVVSTISPVKLYAGDELKILQKHCTSSLPIINEFLWSVVVLTVSPVQHVQKTSYKKKN